MVLPVAGSSTEEILEEIERLRRKRDAVILAHFYQEPAIQDLADFCGDSLALAHEAERTEAKVIVFAGVNFMAETAKILNPSKTVVVPDLNAGCSLADTCPPDQFAAFKKEHPDHVVVTYVNSSAEVKALSDITCTSSNAKKVIASIPENEPILFAPDVNLGRHLAKETGRKMVLWEGVCIVHDIFSEKELLRLKAEHPEAEVLAHPECRESVLRHAHFIGSTTGIIARGVKSEAQVLIIATEPGVLHQLSRKAPHKKLISLPGQDEGCACNVCPHMRLNTIPKLRDCLRDLEPEINLDIDLAKRAFLPIKRMLSLS